MDALKNFAKGYVASAPYPSTSGTGMALLPGNGVLFPTPPFNATVWPKQSEPTASNAEIIRVTAISGDAFTFLRQQEGSNARNIMVGDQVAATITAGLLQQLQVSGVAGALCSDTDPVAVPPSGEGTFGWNRVKKSLWIYDVTGWYKLIGALVMLLCCTNLLPAQAILRNFATTNTDDVLTNIIISLTVNPTNGVTAVQVTNIAQYLDLLAGAGITNGGLASLSNYVALMSQAATNSDLLFGVGATNNDRVVALGATNNDLLTGASITNGGLLNLSNYVAAVNTFNNLTNVLNARLGTNTITSEFWFFLLGLSAGSQSPWIVDVDSANHSQRGLRQLDMTNLTSLYEVLLTGTNTLISGITTNDAGGVNTNQLAMGTTSSTDTNAWVITRGAQTLLSLNTLGNLYVANFATPTNAPVDGYVVTATGAGGDSAWKAATGGSGGSVTNNTNSIYGATFGTNPVTGQTTIDAQGNIAHYSQSPTYVVYGREGTNGSPPMLGITGTNSVVATTNLFAQAWFAVATNYIAANWVPEIGKVKYLGSNNAVYSVSTTRTNLISAP